MSRHPVNVAHHDRADFGARAAEGVAARIGSWSFIIWQTLAVIVWVAVNILAVSLRWDVYPFVLLNLMFSVQAAYTGPILLLASNRQSEKDRARLEHDFANNERTLHLVSATCPVCEAEVGVGRVCPAHAPEVV